MIPDVVLHNSISLDGSLTNFDVNMELHYQLAGNYDSDARLIGSNTIRTGIELYGESSKEVPTDFKKPKRNNKLPFWIIIDSQGTLKNKLHEVRRFEFSKDVIILISETTPKSFIEYLEKRDYSYQIVGKDKVDIQKSLEFVNKKYKVKSILTDTGRILGNILLNHGFVKEISLLIHPVIVGENSFRIFKNINNNLNLKLIKSEIFDDSYTWLVYQVLK
jgi:2,5-diamino-6-(ribosylamino)-4(3H)-pyrimidinone 5'-phosphate reductase